MINENKSLETKSDIFPNLAVGEQPRKGGWL